MLFSKIRALFLLLLLCLLGTFQPVAAQPSEDYELGGGDSVRIAVFLNPDLTTEARLSESGQITFPLVGPVRLGGLTTQQAERAIAARLKGGNFVQDPQVTVAVVQYRSQQVAVLGNVSRPGRYPIEARGTRLTEVLATAGGIAAGGADTVIVVRRGSQGRVERHEIDVPAIYLEGKADLDIVMQGGDSVYVHRQPVFYVYGQVQRPGHYPLERGTTVAQAIAKGGSFTQRSRESGIRLTRRDANGRYSEITPKMDDLLQPDDQLYVRESLF